MARPGTIRSLTMILAASSLAWASAVQAAPASPTSVSPLVALSAFGTPQSAAAVSKAPAVAPYAMSAAALAQTDYDDDDGSTLPVLIALGAILVLILVFHDEIFDEGGHIEIPIPISPQ